MPLKIRRTDQLISKGTTLEQFMARIDKVPRQLTSVIV